MSITLDQARGIVQGIRPPAQEDPRDPTLPPSRGGGGGDTGTPAGFDPNTYGKNPSSSLPPGWVVNPRTGELLPPDSGGATGGAGIPPGNTFQVGNEYYQWNGRSITEASQQEIEDYLGRTGGDGTGASAGWRSDRAFNRGVYEDERNFGYNKEIDARDYARSILESDRTFGQGQIQDNRTELGNRFAGGVSLGNLFLDLARREDENANDPGNFPAYLSSMQNVPGMQPALQALTGGGVSINPQRGPNTNYLYDPRFKSVIDSMLGYANAPSGGDVDRVQQAYNQDPEAARRWFEAATALDKGRGMATGGSFTTQGPMSFRDLSTGHTRVAGEAGPEQVTVTPLQQELGVSQNDPRFGSAGTFGALAKAIRAGGMGSAFPQDVLARMEAGYAPNPGDVPDWLLQRLTPSLRALLGAGVMAQLGKSGAEDYDFTRGLYEAKGFDNTMREVVR